MNWPALVGLFLFSFVSEDAAVFGGAALAATSTVQVIPALLTCFLGIWLGDLGLYGLARWGGRPLLDKLKTQSRFRFLTRWWHPEKIAQSETWLTQKGLWLLVTSRFLPGSRLPVYLAAGVLRYPLGLFALITGGVGLVWVAIIFAVLLYTVPRFFPSHLGEVLLSIFFLLLFVMLLRAWKQKSLALVWQRLWQWEFWPAGIFYLPLGIYYPYLALKYRGALLPSCANPGMHTGGLVGESKYATLRELGEVAPEFTAKTALIDSLSFQTRLEMFRKAMLTLDLVFPVVLKPDNGQRGVGFKIIRSLEAAQDYLSQITCPLLLQEYLPGPYEAGLFYYRFPEESRGHLWAITEKIFPVLVGDGRLTVRELIAGDPRAKMIQEIYLKRFATEADRVLLSGELFRLVEAGNHAQGALFQDGVRFWSPALEQTLDQISQNLTGFYIGRYDIRYSDPAALLRGEQFKILELNGASSEATSLYDAQKSLPQAYSILFAQWQLVFAIGAANRALGAQTTPARVLFHEWLQDRRRSNQHLLAD